jgi:SAM-dependent methyltransferase
MDAQAWDERYAAARQWSVEPNGFVAQRLGDLTPGRGLDLACGEGRNAVWLAGLGWQMTALDFSSVALERGQEAAASLGEDVAARVDWVVGDALEAPLAPHGPLDLVVLAYLQLPAVSRRTVVRRAWEALAPGGTFFLVAHDSTNLTEGTGGPQDAAVLYTATDVLGDLDGVGDPEVVAAERVARVVTADDGHGGTTDRTAWDALVHLVRPAR